MLVKLIIRLSALSLGLSYVTCTTPQQQSQLATLHERMNQMISALYSSPLLSKVQAAATTSEEPPSSSPQESTYSYNPAAPAPQVVFVSPPGYLEAGAQPTDYGYPLTTNPVPRAAWPYQYDYSSYQPQYAPSVYSHPYPRPLYPEYPRPSYAVTPAPQPTPLPPAYPSPMPYPSYPSPVQYSNSPFPITICQPGFSVAPNMPAPYPPQFSYAPSSYPAPVPYPSYPATSLPYVPPVPAPYSSPLPQQYAPPSPYSSPVPMPYPSSVPIPYPPPISLPYGSSISYPQPMYSSPPTFPKPSDMLPQPQYEYSG